VDKTHTDKTAKGKETAYNPKGKKGVNKEWNEEEKIC